ncbi:sensor histidine kinase [Gorillibacterium massiliense]|uniref:sensor histidine kinase n=1 Tax=Gorillibacterium massiliense TaxID=1280390 RepID=UPI0004B2778A|nr:sensor histidine kinase [Gorillibacterium massiliense]
MQADAIDRVIKKTIEVMEDSKYQIFEICESVRAERDALNQELQLTIEETTDMIDQVDKLEMQYRRTRIRLTEVSRDFHRFREEDIRVAYEEATQLQLQLTLNREKENQLRQRRNELQKRIKNVDRQVERAETLVSQMNVVLEYLSGDLDQITRILESAKNRQLLGLKIILAQEDERKRIAREIHDGLAQTMANLVLRTEIAERMLAKQEYIMVKDELVDLKGQMRSGLEEVRKIIFNLRPMTLDDLGLVPTLRKFTQDFEEKTKIRTQFEINGRETRMQSGMEVAVYRLIQEAFSNILKHAEASFIELDISFKEQDVIIVVRDNGKGFDVEQMETISAKGTHFGIMGMKERLKLLEGELYIESAKDAGTKLTINIPLNPRYREE